MKHLFIIIAVLFSVSSFGQLYNRSMYLNSTQMTATQTTTLTDQKFETVKRSFDQCKQQIKQQLIQESIQNNVKSKAAINKLMTDIQALINQAESKFTVVSLSQITVDSLQTVNHRKYLTTEINRLKAETLLAGSDSTMIRPSIDQLKAQRSRLVSIMNTWVVRE